ncbi:UvrD-helicase domain-containing protein [Companilactobacillus kimchiensis]|uniref:DNA 3'-5' helicase n=1 Tax=Companilactobacillus kimchiensis TaxID=993692 RepID=A0A0R2LLE9_9LACO|nr:ATP-dependent helicase [Companilactobacillus kimchiensis]KRN99012.1 UvrD REP helicase [Companilactobacillus kimchiensis]
MFKTISEALGDKHIQDLSTQEIIDLMESGLNMKFSAEQVAILKNDFMRPLLVNACAGSGKTTIFILMALIAIAKGNTEPNEILGITFSHKSRVDMGERFDNFVSELSDTGLDLSYGRPNFTTFHALFYQLLRQNPEYRTAQILTTYRLFIRDLSDQIKHPSNVITKAEMLEEMFDLNGYMINQGLTRDGILPDESVGKPLNEAIKVMAEYSRQNHTDEFYEDYVDVINKYQELKRQNGYIDFNDMKLLLLESMNDPQYLQYYQNIMSRYKIAVIDEFQDIDNLQWQIISKLLSPETMAHLIVIGDDDQSIYSFRGSNPKYILNYKRLLPNAQKHNLSTNYRTGEKILKRVIPLIKKNHVRLDKELLSGRKDQGKFVLYSSKKSGFSDDSKMLRRLVKQINDPEINNDDIAILVRYNSSRMLLADWLANQKIYANINNAGAILQNNLVYRIITELMKSLWQDKYKYFADQANRIGFRAYKDHTTKVEARTDDKFHKLSKYLLGAEAYNAETNTPYKRTDDRVKVYFNSIKRFRTRMDEADNEESRTKLAKSLIKDLYKAATKLTDKYFDYMEEKNFMSKVEVNDIKKYLEEELDKYDNIDDFFFDEEHKKEILSDRMEQGKQEHRIQFLSLHQAKGLEFKYVYLYGLTNKEVESAGKVLNDWFPPEMPFDQFTKQWKLVYNQSFKFLENALKSAHIDDYKDITNNNAFNPINIEKTLAKKKEFAMFHAFYKEVENYSAFIEEERRLLYVGVTRAQQELCLRIAPDSNPLLFDLNLPKKKPKNTPTKEKSQ